MPDTIAHYQIGAKLGEGGMGEVYRATDTKLNRDVALKILPEQFAADSQRMGRFQREAQLLASLSHPNIGSIYGLEEQDGTHAIVLELIEGEGLDEVIARGPLPLERALQIALQIAEALEAAHEKGITHRDLKPANIKLTPEGAVKVLDFGLAKAAAPDPDASSPDLTQSPTLTMAATQAGIILGTAAYMSPEQAQGLPADRRADIWAWGVVLFEMLTGRKVFEGENLSMVMAHVLSQEPDWERLPSDLPTRVRDLLEHCLRKDPAVRLQAVGDARIAIQDYLAAPEEERAAPVAGATPARSKLPWIVAGTLAAVAGVLGIQQWTHTEPEPPGFAFTLPEVEGDVAPLHFAVSPDGRSIVRATQQGLWLRRFDEPEGRLLPHIGGYPFWSPDSRWIGFITQGSLRKTRAEGGPSQAICDLAGGRFFGASWGDDGTIVFSRFADGQPALHQVAAAGGEPRRLDFTVESYDGKLHPQFLPGGKALIFLASSQGNVEGGRIYALTLPDLNTTPVVASNHAAVFSASGHVLFEREGSLMAQAFDPAALAVEGEAFPIAEGLMLDTPNRMAAVSAADNGLLAFRGGEARNTVLQWFERNGTAAPAGPQDGYDSPPRPSLDSANGRMAVVQGSPADIWIVDLQRGTSTRATFNQAVDNYPILSPDGEQFVFSSLRESSQEGLYLKATSGTGEAELLLSLEGERAIATDWSRDGRYILFTRIGEGRSIWALPLEGDREPIEIADVPFDMRHGKISPDGRWVAYASAESGPSQIYMVPFPSSGRQGKWQISADGGAQPVWSPDGREVFFLSPDLALMAVDVTLGETPTIGAVRNLFAVPGLSSNTERYAVSGDGQRFLMPTVAGGDGTTAISIRTNWLAGR